MVKILNYMLLYMGGMSSTANLRQAWSIEEPPWSFTRLSPALIVNQFNAAFPQDYMQETMNQYLLSGLYQRGVLFSDNNIVGNKKINRFISIYE